MSAILSREVPKFDISAGGFEGAARDVGEVVAYLAGGVRPDPDTLSRLSVSMRAIRKLFLDLRDIEVERGKEVGIVLLPILGEIA